MYRNILIFLVLVSVAAACNRSSEVQLTTTTTTATSIPTATTAPVTTTTTTTATPEGDQAEPVETYDVVIRSATDEGEMLWIVIPPGNYNQLSLEGLITRVIEETDATVIEIHVFDDSEALEAGRVDASNRTAEEQQLVESHYLVSLLQGNIVRFQGPFSDAGEYVLGS